VGLEAGSDIGASIRNPAHYCGVYGHKPTFGIIPVRGQALPGVLAAPDIAVVGPMARSAEDLATALDVMAGPDVLDAVAWRLDLPAPRREALRDYRVAVMLDDPACPVDREVADRLQHVADTLARLGASVSDRARPAIDTARSHSVYLHLLRAVTTAGYPPALVEAAQRTAQTASADDRSYVVEVARGTVMSHRQWILENEERVHLQARWAEFFDGVDVLLCPAAPTTAFPHDQQRPREERTITVNGRPVDALLGGTERRRLPSVDGGAGRTRAQRPSGRGPDRRCAPGRPDHHRLRPAAGGGDRRVHGTPRLRGIAVTTRRGIGAAAGLS
jgi:amidase